MNRTVVFGLIGIVIVATSTLYFIEYKINGHSSIGQTKFAMEDMVLQPNEVPKDFSPMASVPWRNPGFITGDHRTEIASGFGDAHLRAGRIYAAIYKNYETAGDLSFVVFEYENTSDLEADLANMRAKEDSMIENTGTYTTLGNYIISVHADELANELTQQLMTKLSL